MPVIEHPAQAKLPDVIPHQHVLNPESSLQVCAPFLERYALTTIAIRFLAMHSAAAESCWTITCCQKAGQGRLLSANRLACLVLVSKVIGRGALPQPHLAQQAGVHVFLFLT